MNELSAASGSISILGMAVPTAVALAFLLGIILGMYIRHKM